ncbi:MAG: cation transporter [Deltaproteobacteria bacterium]|nr:cation transporter [Deltaproteobacteria bacterium]
MSLDNSLSHTRIHAIRWSLATAIFLSILKLSVGMYTDSMAILALAVDSFGDVISSLFNYFFLSKAQEPADAEHHYGHGKFENFASFIQGFILAGTAGVVIYRAILKLMEPMPLFHVELGMVVVVLSFALSFVVGRYVQRIAVSSHSQLLEVEAQHLLMDSYLYLIVLLSLLFSKVGFFYVDPIGSLLVAFFIVRMSGKIIKSSFDVLTDRALTEEENEQIRTIIRDHSPTILGYDRLKTRRSGPTKHIIFRVFICRKMTLGQAHEVVDHIEKEIASKISESEVVIHPEPTKEDCSKHQHILDPRHFVGDPKI